MPPDLLDEKSVGLVATYPLAVAVVALTSALIYIYRQKGTQRDKHDAQVDAILKAHKIEIAAERVLVSQLYEERIKETRIITELVKSMEATLEAFLLSVRRSGQ